MVPKGTIEQWLREDIGHHDITNAIPGTTSGKLIAKESGILAGIDVAEAIFEYLGVSIRSHLEEGSSIEKGDSVLTVEGKTKNVLRGERLSVNITSHASGIATKTDQAVRRARVVSDTVRIAATRKTTPGLRGIEKRAVVAGGGDSHRLDLSHMVMIKDNHIAELGLESAIERFRKQKSFATKIEVEVESPAAAERADKAGADIILLDNMDPGEIGEAIDRISSDTLTEASGNIDLENIHEYAASGVDIISMGSLTHSAPALDFSFQTGTFN